MTTLLPSEGVFQRAVSKRLEMGVASPAKVDPLDASQHPEHVPDDIVDSSVITSSSAKALATFLSSSKYRDSVRGFGKPSAPFYERNNESVTKGSDDSGRVDGVSVGQSCDREKEDLGDEPDEAPPLKRGIFSSTAVSAGSGGFDDSLRTSMMETEERMWEPNMQLSLGEFDQDFVDYLAEGAMCQCFLARKLPTSMNIPIDVQSDSDEDSRSGNNTASTSTEKSLFAKAREHGVIIKTPAEGPNKQMSENDLAVESLVLRELYHPNIVGILGGGKTHTGTSFICLEYLSGGTLKARLDKCGGGLGLNSAVKYGMQLASALSYMHDGGMPGSILMHRDLKPDNIGFSSSGVAKLMDFGLAKIIHRTIRCGSVKYNMTGETGSPRYMPPEVALSQPYNEKADVWSFMVIVWQMVSGRLPFAGMSMQMYLHNVCEGGQRPLVQSQWPADFKNLLRDSWQRDPDLRPSFREIHAVLSDMHNDINKPKKKSGFFNRKR